MPLESKYALQIRRDKWQEKGLFKFGFNTVSTTEETIWDGGGIYAYPSSAVVMAVTSAAGATDSGVKITVQGLDTNYAMASEEVTLDASGTATTTTAFLRTYRAFVSGSSVITGDVTISNSSVTYAKIKTGENQTLMTVWTVPAGYTAYIQEGYIGSGTAQSNKYATARIVTRQPSGVFRTQFKTTLHNETVKVDLGLPIVCPEKTDIEVRAKTSSGDLICEG
jgi:hypothetical protein